jgi:hypothetical protein
MEHQQPSSSHIGSTPAKGAVNPEAIAKGYEPQDLQLRSVFVFIGGLAVTLFVVLSVIYAIMMALAAYDRSGDPVGSPVLVKLPPVYAPLQPSLEHQQFDSDDVLAMRERNQADLNATDPSPAGRPRMPIALAMEKAIPLLLTKAVIQPGEAQPYPDGSFEGHLGGTAIPAKKPHVWSNDMSNLNNQGNRFP